MALKTNLVSVWELNEASGNALDSHGSHPLTETSGTIASAAGPSGLSGARDFELTDTERFEVANHADLQTGDIDFTISAWVRLESLVTSIIIAKDNTSGTGREYLLFYNHSTTRFRFDVFKSGPTAVSVSANSLGAPSTATWYHLVAWHDAAANEIGIRVNAGTADTQATAGSLQASGTAAFAIGDRSGAVTPAPWDGLIAQAAMWKNRVLTSGDCTELHAGGNGLPYSSWDAGGASEGVVSQTLGAITSAATGSLDINGSVSQTLGAIAPSATASVGLNAAVGQALGEITPSATGSVSLNAAVAQTLGAVTADATGSIGAAVTGAVSQTLDPVTSAATGSISISGVVSAALGTITAVATGVFGAGAAVVKSVLFILPIRRTITAALPICRRKVFNADS